MSTVGNTPKSQLYAGPGYNLFDPSPHRQFDEETSFLAKAAMQSAAMTNAAEVEVSAVDDVDADEIDTDDTKLDNTCLYSMSIDDLRIVAGLLNVPGRELITNRDEFIAAIEHAE